MNYWAVQPVVTQNVGFVVATDAVERTVAVLEEAGFSAKRRNLAVGNRAGLD